MNKNTNFYLIAALQMILILAILVISSEIYMLLPAGRYSIIASLFIPAIYILFIIVWMITVFVRVNQREAKKYLLLIGVTEVFWLVIKCIQFNITSDIVSGRHLWYLFYLGVIIIPLYTLFVSISLGHDEHYHLPLKYKLLYVPALILILQIWGNDYNQNVFVFRNGLKDYTNYSYGFVYYLVVAWIILCYTSALYNFITKSRYHRGRVDARIAYIPLAFIVIVYLYNALSHADAFGYNTFSNDITSLFCISIVLILETFIQCGIIPSNHSYRKVFNLSTNGVLVVDKQSNIMEKSKDFSYDTEKILKMAPGECIINNKKRLSKIKTRTGYIVWEDDISRLLDSIEELMDLNEQLSENIYMLQEEYDSSRRHQKLVERNRIYDLMQTQTTSRIKHASEYVEELEHCTDPAQEKIILTKLVILTTYIKRRNNLIFLAEDNHMLPVSELTYCIRETTDNMNLYDITSSYHISLNDKLPIYTIMNIYDLIQDVLELAFEGLSYFYVSLKKNDLLTLTIRLDTKTDFLAKSDLKKYAGADITLEQEDDNSYIVKYRTAEE